MDSTIITAFAGVLGSLVGGTATVATTWVTQRTQSKRKLIRAEIKKREELYGEFISECSKRAIESFERNLEKPEALLTMYELVNRIRLCASNVVLREAERAVGAIVDQYFASNLSAEEMRALLRREKYVDPLGAFAEACRSELKGLSATT